MSELLAQSAGDDGGGMIVFAVIVALLLAYGAWKFFVDPFLSTRPCPRCGRRVPKGEMDCPHCEFDFRSIGA
jgi:hypothetical protein